MTARPLGCIVMGLSYAESTTATPTVRDLLVHHLEINATIPF